VEKISVERTETPPCSRCGRQLLIAANTPPGVDGPLVELCRWCDEGTDSAAGRLVAMFAAGLTAEDAPAAGELMLDWYREVMASRGWYHCPDDHSDPAADEEASFATWEAELEGGVRDA
jgi:hypothetical protein